MKKTASVLFISTMCLSHIALAQPPQDLQRYDKAILVCQEISKNSPMICNLEKKGYENYRSSLDFANLTKDQTERLLLLASQVSVCNAKFSKTCANDVYNVIVP